MLPGENISLAAVLTCHATSFKHLRQAMVYPNVMTQDHVLYYILNTVLMLAFFNIFTWKAYYNFEHSNMSFYELRVKWTV